MTTPVVDVRLTALVLWRYVLRSNLLFISISLFVVILFVLQWLFNLDQLREIVLGDNGLSIVSRIDFLVDGLINVFRYGNAFVPISMIVIAMLQALTVTLFIATRHVSKKGMLGYVFSLMGVGCVACGGSILTPILGIVASGVSISLAENVSRLLLVVAVVLSYISLSDSAYAFAKMKHLGSRR